MLSILLATLTSTALADMNCNAEKVNNCPTCKSDISVSCAQDAYKGFADKSTKPSTLTLSITNQKTGSVRFIEIPNNKTLESLTNTKTIEQDAEVVEELKKKKIKVGDKTKIDLVHFQLKDSTILYSDSGMKKTVAINKAIIKKQSRMVASEGPAADAAGGVGRAVESEKSQ